jgi:hypothetical protein
MDGLPQTSLDRLCNWRDQGCRAIEPGIKSGRGRDQS